MKRPRINLDYKIVQKYKQLGMSDSDAWKLRREKAMYSGIQFINQSV